MGNYQGFLELYIASVSCKIYLPSLGNKNVGSGNFEFGIDFMQ